MSKSYYVDKDDGYKVMERNEDGVWFIADCYSMAIARKIVKMLPYYDTIDEILKSHDWEQSEAIRLGERVKLLEDVIARLVANARPYEDESGVIKIPPHCYGEVLGIAKALARKEES